MKVLSDFVRNSDIFGESVTLRYKGNTSYQTVTGGACSLIVSVLVLIFSVV